MAWEVEIGSVEYKYRPQGTEQGRAELTENGLYDDYIKEFEEQEREGG